MTERDDESDDFFESIYDDGHWEWDEKSNQLEFRRISAPLEEIEDTRPAMVTKIEFADDLDVIQQHRFKKRYQRKTSDEDVVILQDIKDLVIYTTPKYLVSSGIITILHAPITERFLRALLMYCQYYLQLSDEMGRRVLELQEKLRTANSIQIESEYAKNLKDLRLILGKEYANMVFSGRSFCHFQPGKNKVSYIAQTKDSAFFETVLRMSIQIVYISLGRTGLHDIEIEVHRLFKSSKFNIIATSSKKNYEKSLTSIERAVLVGQDLNKESTLQTRSPLINEVMCPRPDYRIFGAGALKYSRPNSRLKYFEDILTAPEDVLVHKGITLGILGLPRSKFDTMLREISLSSVSRSNTRLSTKFSQTSNFTSTSSGSHKRKSIVSQKLYHQIVIPPESEKAEEDDKSFPTNVVHQRLSVNIQREKWLERFMSGKRKKGSS